MRSSYWTCSNFAKWLRRLVGVDSPSSATAHGWKTWKTNYKNSHPVMFYVTEILLGKLQRFVCYPKDKYREISTYLHNRFIFKSHYLSTNLKVGQYHEIDTRILHGMFETLVEFVEGEKAHMQWAWVEGKDKAHNRKDGRELGLKYLKSETEFEDHDSQAKTAQEIIDLYVWWKDIRPSRLEPMDASGYSSIKSENFDDVLDLLSAPRTPERTKAAEIMHDIEKSYDKEDEEMLVRLIKIRKSLWT